MIYICSGEKVRIISGDMDKAEALVLVEGEPAPMRVGLAWLRADDGINEIHQAIIESQVHDPLLLARFDSLADEERGEVLDVARQSLPCSIRDDQGAVFMKALEILRVGEVIKANATHKLLLAAKGRTSFNYDDVPGRGRPDDIRSGNTYVLASSGSGMSFLNSDSFDGHAVRIVDIGGSYKAAMKKVLAENRATIQGQEENSDVIACEGFACLSLFDL